MHIFADFDNQTKLMHVGYSILGTLISLLVLVKLKPAIVPRMVAAVIFTVILLFCFSQPLTGDQERLKTLYGTGWFFFGLLFGIGRGEFFIEWLTIKMFGSPKAALEKKEEAEKLAAESVAKCAQDANAVVEPEDNSSQQADQ